MSITDYSAYAAAYERRPAYAPQAISDALQLAGIRAGDRVCDVGAGTGRLTRLFAAHGLVVDAVEPTDAMREVGKEQTAGLPDVAWHVGSAQDTGRPSQAYRLVSFGSSFNVVPQDAALAETARILAADGWLLCCWHHIALDDPLQRRIEDLIKRRVPGWSSGIVGTDPTAIIAASSRFGPVSHVAVETVHVGDTATWCAAWSSHMTLDQAAGDDFPAVVDEIEQLVRREAGEQVRVPYTTRVWFAPLAGGER
jgi:SAM-dependent methyltransferase